MKMNIVQTAIHYAAMGFAVHWLTPRQKGPRDRGWSTAPVADAQTLRARFTPRSNLGVRCGHWSRPQADCGLVIVDLDIQTAEGQDDALQALARLLDADASIPTVMSGRGNGSRHLWFACPLERLPDKASCTIVKTAHWQIEVLSTGKQVVCPPSIHPHGATYYWTHPLTCPLPLLPEALHTAIYTAVQAEHTVSRTRGRTVEGPGEAAPGARPGDHYNHLLQWADILEPAGWQAVRAHEDVTYWCRPGKSHGISASTGGGGYDVLYVFSSNADPLRERTSYSKFGAYAVLQHGGDFAQAARTLGARGYGQQWVPRNGQHATEPPGPAAETRHQPEPRRPHVVHMDQVTAQPLEWLWWPYIARGTVTMLDGDPGIGKSLLTLYLGAIVSNGHPLPDQHGKPTLPLDAPGTVVLLSAEDSVTHTIKQRLNDSKANQRHIKVVTSYFDEHGEEQFLTLEADNRPLLAQVLQEYSPALVIIDPLQAFLGKMDMHRANETRPFMRGLQHLAETYQTSIVCVRHPAKPGQTVGKSIHRGMGSVDFIGAARSGLFVEQHPTDRDKVLLCHFKNNLAPLGRTQVFSKKAGAFAWAGITRLSADHIAGQGRGPHPYAFLEACFWLEEQFKKTTTQGSKDLQDKADEAEINWRLLNDAKKALGITSQKVGKKAWLWMMPPLEGVAPPSSVSTTTTTTHTTHTTHTTPSSPSSDGRRASGTGEATEEGVVTSHGEQGEQGEQGEEGEGCEVDAVVVEDMPPGRMRFATPATRTRGPHGRTEHPQT